MHISDQVNRAFGRFFVNHIFFNLLDSILAFDGIGRISAFQVVFDYPWFFFKMPVIIDCERQRPPAVRRLH